MEKETKHTLGRFSITDNLTAVINSQADRIIEAENSGKALLRIIERLEGQISEMKKENASLQPENTRLKSELLHRDVTVLPQKDFEFEEMKASLQLEIEKFRDEFKCPQCMGHGWFQSNNGNQPTQDQCHVCYGTGTLGRGYFQLEIDRLQTELSEMKAENERLKAEIMQHGDTIVSLGKVLLKPSEREELSEMKKEREELVKALSESQILMHECIQVFNGSYQLDNRYNKLLALTEKIEHILYAKEKENNG